MLSSVKKIRFCLLEIMKHYVDFPPDSDFKRGYLAAIRDFAKEIGVVEPKGLPIKTR